MSRRFFFTKTKPGKPKGELAWNRVLSLPEDCNNIIPNLKNSFETILKSRWNQSSSPNLLATGQLRKTLRSLEHGFLFRKDDPNSLLAKLRLCHQIYVELNLSAEACLSVARFDAIGIEQKGSAYAMAAFAHQMDWNLEKAEELASRSLGIDDTNLWAILTLTEIYEKQGRYREGLRLLRELEDTWLDSPLEKVMMGRKYFFLFELAALGAIDECLRCYDACVETPLMFEEGLLWSNWVRNDSAALVWRVNLSGLSKEKELMKNNPIYGFPFSDTIRAEKLIKHELKRVNFKRSASDGVFFTLAMLAAGSTQEQILESVNFLSKEDFENGEALSQNHDTNEEDQLFIFNPGNIKENDVLLQIEEVGKPIVMALSYLADEKHDVLALRSLLNVRSKFNRIGGLESTRDTLDQTLLVHALRCARKNREFTRYAYFLSLERLLKRPCSPQNWIWHGEILELSSDFSGAEAAHAKAMDLVMGKGGRIPSTE